MGIIGTIMGIAGGITLALNIDTIVPALERTFGIQFLDKSVYYISEVPSDLQRGDITMIALIAFAGHSVVAGLNALGVNPRDMISILQTIKAAGALQADIQVL